jgi:hypothetical protein
MDLNHQTLTGRPVAVEDFRSPAFAVSPTDPYREPWTCTRTSGHNAGHRALPCRVYFPPTPETPQAGLEPATSSAAILTRLSKDHLLIR